MSLKLITQELRFRPLFWTQFFGALNDNLLKNALVVLVTFKGISLWGLNSQSLVAFSGGIFILPFFLLSSTAGNWADGFQRQTIVRIVKIVEVLIMLLAAFGFGTDHYGLLFLCLALMGIHSTFFGPVKYSLIPDLVKEQDIVAGNAMIEVGTFLAILIGTIAGGVLISLPQGATVLVTALLLVSVAGLFFGFKVPVTQVAQPALNLKTNPFPDILKNLKEIMPQKAVWNSILGISWFWFFGAALMSLLPVYTKEILHCNEHVVTFFLAVFTMGIATGSVLCEKFSFGKVEIGLVPLGSLGMTVFLADLVWNTPSFQGEMASALMSLTQFLNSPHSYHVTIDLFLLSVFGGVFTVPLYSLIQTRSHSSHRSRVIALNNIFNALFMVTSAVLIIVLTTFGWNALHLFLLFSALNLVAAFYIYSIVPEFTLRFLVWGLGHVLYQIKHQGAENIPKEGPALLVCNHVTSIDWLLISAVIKRPIRFVMHYQFANNFFMRLLAKDAKVILIAGQKEDPGIFKKAFESIAEQLAQGELVCVFPEGTLTPDGELHDVKPGYQHVLAANPVPLIPMSLRGLWGSMLSRFDKKLTAKRPRKLWQQIDLLIGPAERAPYPEAIQLKEKLLDLFNRPMP